jgi:hypothetical protein
MKRLLSFAVIIILTVIDCLSQNDWKPGYIISNSNDTVHGFIDNRDSKSNSKRCYFRKEDSGEKELFKPEDISGFRFINGKFFISKTIPVEDSKRRVFLEFVVHGKADIFHYKDDDDYYFIEKEGKLFELKNTSEIQRTEATKLVSEKTVEHEKKEYIGVLNFLMYDAKMQSEINNSTLDTRSLINIAKKYHERVCSGEQCIVYEKKSNMHVKWGFHFGESMNSFNFGDRFATNYGISTFAGSRIKIENAFNWEENISFSADITFHRFSKYELHQISYNSIVVYNNLEYTISPGSKLNVDLELTALKIPITVNYTFYRGKVRPYIGLGLSNTFILSQNKNFIYRDFYNSFKKSVPSNLILGLVGKIGSEFIFKNTQSIYFDISMDYSQNSQTGAFLFTNKLFSITTGYAF